MGEAERKTYIAAFEAKVGLEAICGVKTVNELGRDYGVHVVRVWRWKCGIQARAETLFSKKREARKEDGLGDTDRLCSEIGRLKVELDWLQ